MGDNGSKTVSCPIIAALMNDMGLRLKSMLS